MCDLPQVEEREYTSLWMCCVLSKQYRYGSPHVRHGIPASRDKRCNLYFAPVVVRFSNLTRAASSFVPNALHIGHKAFHACNKERFFCLSWCCSCTTDASEKHRDKNLHQRESYSRRCRGRATASHRIKEFDDGCLSHQTTHSQAFPITPKACAQGLDAAHRRLEPPAWYQRKSWYH